MQNRDVSLTHQDDLTFTFIKSPPGFRSSINRQHFFSKVRNVFSLLAHNPVSHYCVGSMMEIGNLEDFSLQEPSRVPQEPHPLQIIRIESTGSMRQSTVTPCIDGSFANDNLGNTQVEYLFPEEAWLPITESRNGNVFSVVVHLLSSGIGFQALLLPVAFATLGRSWGIISLSLAFAWQLYTTWLLVQLAEPVPGARYCRYPWLATYAFGEKLGKRLALSPVMYLSGVSYLVLQITTAGGNMKTLYKYMCDGGAICEANSLSGSTWFLIFTCMAILVAQFPNLNSITKISVIGAVTALVYCTLLWILPITKGRPSAVSYGHAERGKSDMAKFSNIFNAIGIIVLAFRGHNLVLEIQGTLPSDQKQKSSKPMWRGVTISYLIIAMCLFPLAIAGFWAYGNKVPINGGLLTAFLQVHGPETQKYAMGIIYLLALINNLTSFQIYAMPVFDNLEFRYIMWKKKRCTWWVRTGLRLFFGGLAFFIAVAFPFLGSLAPVIRGITLPLTYVYPCFMYISIKKPRSISAMWWLNFCLGCLGSILSVMLVVAALWNLATEGLKANFFRP
ncbi:lysine histidine transporter-like 7 [Mangifera indica]|uniref:lysine histidine transporter-like 7 n=1 Tax=Mangifera indica TaxID=29780 RepID=UPI001CFB049C|nr:lysine histidine transporter-like 7 [Mangifera indica]